MAADRKTAIRMIAGVLLVGSLLPRPAQAMSRDLQDIFIVGAYGAVAGTALGIIAWPLTGNGRNVFVGTSIGLYLGLIAGYYYISNRDDPTNPLRPENLPQSLRDPTMPPDPLTAAVPPPVVELSYPIVTF